MKAVVVHSPGNLSIQDVEMPKVGAEDVLVKVRLCGIFIAGQKINLIIIQLAG